MISIENVFNIWSINTTKMHFQQNVCFQLRNWAFGITSVVIPLIWASSLSDLTSIFIHLTTILIMLLILNRDLSWHAYRAIYTERARLCERVIMEDADISMLKKEYFKYIPKSNMQLLQKSFFTKYFIRFKTDYIELYLILILLLSMFFKIILNS